ncbi:MAG: energy-coupling factor transporter ATPase [Pyrinomonadaceae bacterium]|nr:energy-coupling factor transporter ATPase [Pyrinomonadaceae bacterium]
MVHTLEFNQLSFTYNRTEKPALKKIEAQVGKGEFVVLMGAGGSGKSSLCYTPNGVIPHLLRGKYSGDVLFNGASVATKKVWELARSVGLVMQDFESHLFSSSVELEMAFGLENLGMNRAEIGRRIAEYLKIIGLEHKLHFEPSSLSGGQKQKLAIGGVMCMEPELLVMDEPTTDLDPFTRTEILSLSDLVRDRGAALIIADHRSEISLNADSVWLMKNGEIVKMGKPVDVMTDLRLLQDCRVMPPPILELMDALDFPKKIWTVDEAESALRAQIKIGGRSYGNSLINKPPISERSNPIISVRELKYVYDYKKVSGLNDINLDIYEGDFLAIMGPNGSGKTTLAKHFNALLTPAAGQVLLKGKPIDSYTKKEIASQVGYVFQNPDNQIFAPTVVDEVSFSLRQLGFEENVIKPRVKEILQIVGLQEMEEEDPVRLTKGQRQRLAVASAMVTQPPVLVLDEPTKGLDYPHKVELMKLLMKLNNQGHTIIIITHSFWIVAEFASRIIVLNSGKKVLEGQTREIFSREGELEKAGLGTSPLVSLSNRLGLNGITVDKMVQELKSYENFRVS